jgi:hypothetical protein
MFAGEERRIPFIFDDFHFCRSRVIGLDMTENRIFTLCRMIIWVVFLRMFWNFISSLPVKRGGSLSFCVGTISNVLVMEIDWTVVRSGVYILVSCARSNTSLLCTIHPMEYSFIWLLFSIHPWNTAWLVCYFSIHTWEYSFICFLFIHTGRYSFIFLLLSIPTG